LENNMKEANHDADRDDGVCVRKVTCDGILSRVEKRDSERTDEDRHIEVGDPS
jgi:hypothetical protein